MIVLALLVKDEEATVERAIRQALPIVDHVTILDTGSTDVSPCPPFQDAPYGWHGDAETIRQSRRSFTFRVGASDRNDFLLCQFCSAVGLARVTLSPFGGRVDHVVLMRPYEEMSGIHTRWAITSMQDVEAVRDRANEKLVREPMSSRTGVARGGEVTVAVRQQRSLPYPAPRGFMTRSSFVDLAQEPIFGTQTRRTFHRSRALPARVVHPAVAARQVWGSTPRDGTNAYTISHVN